MTFIELQPVLDKLDASEKRRAAAFLINQLSSRENERVENARRSHIRAEEDLVPLAFRTHLR